MTAGSEESFIFEDVVIGRCPMMGSINRLSGLEKKNKRQTWDRVIMEGEEGLDMTIFHSLCI